MSLNIGKTLVKYWLNDADSTAHNTREADIGQIADVSLPHRGQILSKNGQILVESPPHRQILECLDCLT